MLVDDFQVLLKKLKNNFGYLNEVDAVLQVVLPYQPSTIIDYHPAGMIKVLKTIEEASVEDFKKIIMLSCIEKNWNDFSSVNYTPAVLGYFDKFFDRVMNVCEAKEGWDGQHPDVYWKELAIARKIMFPSGAQVAEKYSGFSIKQGIHLKKISTLSFIKYLVLSGSRKGYYQTHLYAPGLDEFNQQGWCERHVRLADMLKLHVDIKGTFGVTWLVDPQLLHISPHLEYLQNIPLKHGAKRFYLGNDETGNALKTSKTRIKLYEEGKFIPRSYMLLWPRKDIISWADNYVKNTST